MELKQYTKEDFLESLEPYEFLYQFNENSLKMEQVATQLSEMAQSLGIRNFKKLFGEYLKSQKSNKKIYLNNVTQFEGCQYEFDTGEWRADEYGVSIETMFGDQFACVHPILPVERLVNIDTGVEKLKLSFRKGRNWKTIIADKKTLASTTSIIGLADCGIAVNSENAKYLVRYLHDIENQNYERIPEMSSVSRLGWIDGEGFAPYVGNLIFDGEVSLKTYFESVKQEGTLEGWKEAAKEARKNITARLVLSASFASALVKPLHCLPFFVHLWGGTEVGKTVGLMMAASAWANPEMGKYIQSFNSTVVGRERLAAFFNSMPLIMDELQIVKDKASFDHDIYVLAEGVGKSRGNKTGGIDKTPTWGNCIITSGEMPLSSSNSGGGAVNRIIEIECKHALFEDPREICAIVKRNYGHAGKQFVEYIQSDGAMDTIERTFKIYHAELSKSNRTEKQAISGALILTADKIVSKLFFDGDSLASEHIKDFLQTKESVNANQKGYEHFCSWVAENSNKFQIEQAQVNGSQVYGRIEGDMAFIINSVFQAECINAGYNYTALLSYLKQKNLIDYGQKSTKGKYINNIKTRCICLKLIQEIDFIFDD